MSGQEKKPAKESSDVDLLEGSILDVSLLFLCIISFFSIQKGHWVFLAIPTGYFFGFFLQRGDLCGASACSEILLFRSWAKLGAFWICIVTFMCGFTLAESLGWIECPAKPLRWLNLIVGGALFGTGMVLAGGCVTGTLFKAGTGNLNSLAALITIPMGVWLVRDGYLSSLYETLSRHTVFSEDGQGVTLASLTGVSSPAWTVFLCAITLIGIGVVRSGKKRSDSKFKSKANEKSSLYHRIFIKPWKPWVAGIAIGLLALPAFIGSCKSGFHSPLGTTGGIYSGVLVIGDSTIDLVDSDDGGPMIKGDSDSTDESRPVVYLWLPLLCAGLVVGSSVAARVSETFRVLPKPFSQVAVAFLGGLMVGVGAALADGCFYGNIVSGCALLNVSGFLFALVTIVAALITTRLYLIGGIFIKAKR